MKTMKKLMLVSLLAMPVVQETQALSFDDVKTTAKSAKDFTVEKAKSVGRTAWNHKKKVIAGTALAVTAGLAFYFREDLKDLYKDSKEDGLRAGLKQLWYKISPTSLVNLYRESNSDEKIFYGLNLLNDHYKYQALSENYSVYVKELKFLRQNRKGLIRLYGMDAIETQIKSAIKNIERTTMWLDLLSKNAWKS